MRLRYIIFCFIALALAAPDRAQNSDRDLNRKLFEVLGDGSTERIASLLKQGAEVNARNDTDRDTPLIISAWNSDAKQVKFLLADGAAVNAVNSEGMTALARALKSPGVVPVPEDVIETVRTLLENGARVDLPDLQGTMPLMYAVENDSVLPAVEMLLAKGAKVEARNNAGQTALTFSANTGQSGSMAALLAHGAEVNTHDNQGTTPLMIAAETGNPETVRLLIQHGAKITEKDIRGRTAAEYVRSRHDLNAAEKRQVLALLQHGKPTLRPH